MKLREKVKGGSWLMDSFDLQVESIFLQYFRLFIRVENGK